MSAEWFGAAVAAAAALLVTVPLARAARTVGLVDPRPGGPVPARKRGQPAIPMAGGAAVLFAVSVVALVSFFGPGGEPAGVLGFDASQLLGPSWHLALYALGLAFLAGLVDDFWPGGLLPAAKLAVEVPAVAFGALALAAQLGWEGPAALFGLALLVLTALQVANTWDHADGFCAGAAAVGLVGPAPVFAGALLGWLPWNLNRRPGRAPTCLLGDSGSHLVGMAIVLVPAAWPALTVAALDLTRVALERVRTGARPWHGDRRHLGQRLAAAGVGPRTAAFAQAFAVMPAVLAPKLDQPLLGFAATAAAYLVLLRATRR